MYGTALMKSIVRMLKRLDVKYIDQLQDLLRVYNVNLMIKL